jgi:hypothetical protein
LRKESIHQRFTGSRDVQAGFRGGALVLWAHQVYMVCSVRFATDCILEE